MGLGHIFLIQGFDLIPGSFFPSFLFVCCYRTTVDTMILHIHITVAKYYSVQFKLSCLESNLWKYIWETNRFPSYDQFIYNLSLQPHFSCPWCSPIDHSLYFCYYSSSLRSISVSLQQTGIFSGMFQGELICIRKLLQGDPSGTVKNFAYSVSAM